MRAERGPRSEASPSPGAVGHWREGGGVDGRGRGETAGRRGLGRCRLKLWEPRVSPAACPGALSNVRSDLTVAE